MTRPLRADALRNKEKLLTVAATAFSEDGVDVPLETIAARAGVGVGTLYRHFPHRNALIEAAYRHEVERLCDAAPELLSSCVPASEALREWMHAFVHYAGTKKGMAEALRSVVGSDTTLLGHTRSQIVAALRVLLTAGAQDGSLRSDADPEDVMRAMGGVWNVGPGPDWEDQVRRLLALLIDGLRYGAPR